MAIDWTYRGGAISTSNRKKSIEEKKMIYRIRDISSFKEQLGE